MSLTYGNYCGIQHYNSDGKPPIDKLDRACQIHDICTYALGLTNCKCSEQLDYLSRETTINDKIVKMDKFTDNKISMNSLSYGVNALSKGFWIFDPNCTIDKGKYQPDEHYIGNLLGFQYLPIYSGVCMIYSKQSYAVADFDKNTGENLLKGKNVPYIIINPGFNVVSALQKPKCIINIDKSNVLVIDMKEYIGFTEMINKELRSEFNLNKIDAIIQSDISGASRLILQKYKQSKDIKDLNILIDLNQSKISIQKHDTTYTLFLMFIIIIVSIVIIYIGYKINSGKLKHGIVKDIVDKISNIG